MAHESGHTDNFLFIDASNSNDGERQRSRRLARRHTTKAVLRKGRRARGQALSNDEASTWTTMDSPASPLLERHPSSTERSESDGRSGVSSASILLSKTPTPRPVSPVFGAVHSGQAAFEPHSGAGEIIHYYMTVVLPNMMAPEDINDRISKSFEYPALFHGLQCVGIWHRVIMRGQASSSDQDRRSLIRQQAETTRLLGNMIRRDMNERTVGAILVTIMCVMWDLDEHNSHENSISPLGFVPFMPSMGWVNVYGQTKVVETHRQGLAAIVAHAGGIDSIQPRLGRLVRLADVIMASMTCTSPLFPWPDGVEDAPFAALHAMEALSVQLLGRPGDGFARLSGKLPDRATYIFINTARLERMLSIAHSRQLSRAEYRTVMYLKSACQFRLLSLLSWQDLSADEQCGCVPWVYEACRVTALLYSNSVIFAIPPRADCHLKLTGQLRKSLESVQAGDEAETALLTWSLYVGAIAAGKSSHQTWFQTALEKVLSASLTISLAQAQTILANFLWTRDACGYATAVVWDMVSVR